MHIGTCRIGVVGVLIALVGCTDGSDDDDLGMDGSVVDARTDAAIMRDAARADGGDAGAELSDLPLDEQRAVCRVLVETIRSVSSDYALSECAEAARRESSCSASRDACAASREAQYAAIWQDFDCENEPERATFACRVTRSEFDACLTALSAAYDDQARRVTCASSESSSPIAVPEPCGSLAGLCDNLASFSLE